MRKIIDSPFQIGALALSGTLLALALASPAMVNTSIPVSSPAPSAPATSRLPLTDSIGDVRPSVPDPTPYPSVEPSSLKHASTHAEKVLTAYTTGFTWYDNTPVGSAQIARPVLHKRAGGTGTYTDPITAATAAPGGRWAYKPGTVFYVPRVQRYFIVEDFGSGRGVPAKADVWLDLWIGGQGAGRSAATRCTRAVTGLTRVILDPGPNHPVAAGAGVLNGSGCQTFGPAPASK